MNEFGLDQQQLPRFRQQLRRWYLRNARPLPWRQTRDPYRIWISEIMLQQTTVSAVIPFYERFLKRFPTLLDVAAASESEVLQYWEGLGYYSRGRNIRKAAIVIRDQFDGQFPDSLDDIQQLPGVGRYTAGAILSFAFDRPAPIVEANTLRVYSRLMGYDGDPRGGEGQELLWSFAESVQPSRKAGTLNQSLMELGATVCTPNEPSCPDCPIKFHCRAYATGTQTEIPQKKARAEPTPLVEVTIAIENDGQYLVRQYDSSGRWEGLWDFPRIAVTDIPHQGGLSETDHAKIERQLRSVLQQQYSVELETFQAVHELRHSVTRYRIRLICCVGKVAARQQESKLAAWRSLPEIRELPLPVTGRKFVNHLNRSDA